MKAFLLLVTILALGCQPIPVPSPPPQPDADSAAPVPPQPLPSAVDAGAGANVGGERDAKADAVRATLIGRACAVLAAMGCPEGAPTPEGESCEQVFTDQSAFPGLKKFPAACIATKTTIATVRACGVKCGGK